MKWFKHMTESRNDPFIFDLMDEFGHFGYAAWFIFLEMISKENGKIVTGKAEFSLAFVRQNLKTSLTKVRLFLNFCQTKGKLSFSISGKNLKIEIPNLLKIKDNHTHNLQVASNKSSPTKKEKEIKKEIKKETPPLPPSQQSGNGRREGTPIVFAVPEKNTGADQVAREFNKILGDKLDRVLLPLDAGRRTMVRARMNDLNRPERLEVLWWSALFQKLKSDPWRMGENDKGWRMTFDWVMESCQRVSQLAEWIPPKNNGDGAVKLRSYDAEAVS